MQLYVKLYLFSVYFKYSVCSKILPLDFYVDREDVNKIFGVDSQLWYIRDGEVNHNALNYDIVIPHYINSITFHWQAKQGMMIPYNLSVEIGNKEALGFPYININKQGHVPNRLSAWTLTLNCSGKLTTQSDVIILLQLPNNVSLTDLTTLQIKRRKVCLRDDKIKHGVSVEAVDIHRSAIIVYVTIGCLSAFLIFVATLAACSHIRGKKRERRARANLRPCSSSETGIPNNQRIPKSGNCSLRDLRCSSQPTNTASATTTTTIISPEPQFHDPRDGDVASKLASLRTTADAISVGKLETEGTFGRIYQGLYDANGHSQVVMIKTVFDGASDVQKNVMVTEGLMLAGLSHENLLSVLVAVTPSSGAPLLVFPKPAHGNFKRFLQNCHTLLTREVVGIGVQVLYALSYLHSKLLLHKDIATRNCVVDESLNIKLTDCALSKDLFPSDYHCLGDNENRPVKWLAMESLVYKIFSPSSDVWSWGVLLWEIMTLGQQPYAEIDPFEMSNILKQGVRLAQPYNCPDELFKAMTFCWALNHNERPSVSDLLKYLKNFLTHLERYV